MKNIVLSATISIALFSTTSLSVANENDNSSIDSDRTPADAEIAPVLLPIEFTSYTGEESPQAVFEYVVNQMQQGNWRVFYARLDETAQQKMDQAISTLIYLEPNNRELRKALQSDSGIERFIAVLNSSDQLKDQITFQDVQVLDTTMANDGETAKLTIGLTKEERVLKDTVLMKKVNGYWRLELG